MPSDKALGPDGFTCLFFKEYWDIVKEDVMNAANYAPPVYLYSTHQMWC
jgi:hypothetical protein